MKYGMFLTLLSLILVLCSSACLDSNNGISQNTVDNGNTTISTNACISNNDENNNLNLNNTNTISNINQTNMNYNSIDRKIIKYNIIEYGKFGEKNDKFFYNYVNKSENKTIIMIFAGKKPVDCDIHIIKIIKINSNSIKVYINESVKNNGIIITSPYMVVEVNGVYNNVEYNYTKSNT